MRDTPGDGDEGRGEGMCIAFSARTVHEYLFSHDAGLDDVTELGKGSVRRFCQELAGALSESGDPWLRHAHFGLGRDEVEAFFAGARGTFLDFGDSVALARPLPASTGEGIERRYEERYGGSGVVTAALRLARMAARRTDAPGAEDCEVTA